MKEFNVGDEFIYCPGNDICLCRIVKLGEWDYEEKCRVVTYRKYTYINNTYDDGKYEMGVSLIFRDEDKDREYIRIDRWFTTKYCIRHMVYCE